MAQTNTYAASRVLYLFNNAGPYEDGKFRTGIPKTDTIVLSAFHCYQAFAWFDAEQMAADLHNRRITRVGVGFTGNYTDDLTEGAVPVRLYQTSVKYDASKTGKISANTKNPASGMTYSNDTNQYFIKHWDTEAITKLQTITNSQLCLGAEAAALVDALIDGCALGSFVIPNATQLYGTYNFRVLSGITITIDSEPLIEVTKPTEVTVIEQEVREAETVHIRVSGSEQVPENPITGYFIKKRYQARQNGDWSSWSNSELYQLAATEGTLETHVNIPGAVWEFSVAATSALNTTEYVPARGSVSVWAQETNRICLFDLSTDDYTGNGIAILHPTSCVAHEEAGAQFELEMSLPMTQGGKWQLAQNGFIVKAKVPVAPTEETAAGDEVEIWRNASTYRQDVYAKAQDPVSIRYDYWSHSPVYQAGAKVTMLSTGKNFQCIKSYPINTTEDWRSAHKPGSAAGAEYWTEIPNQSAQSVVTVLSQGQEFYKTETLGNWLKIRTYNGYEGYIKTIYCQYVRTEATPAIASREAKEQLFRIYAITVNTQKKTVLISARHVSYDFEGNMVQVCPVQNQTASAAISMIRNALLEEYPNVIATNLNDQDGTITQDYSWKNPVKCLLDPDSGIVGICRAKLIRDNWDYFVLKNTEIDRGVILNYGKNLKGVTWKRNADELVTRVIPVAKKANGEDLFLDDLFVDSPLIESWPVIKTERLQVAGKVGEDDGEGGTWTEEKLKAHMAKKAEQRFSIDHADAQTVEIDVDFVLLGDTEEFRQYRGLQKLYIYDSVRVIDKRVGLAQSLQVSKYDWDVIRQRYTKITLGNVFDYGGRTTAGYSIANAGIEFDKLSPAAVSRIRNG